MTPEEHLALAKVNPELEEILKASPPPVGLNSKTDIPSLRTMLLERKRKMTLAYTASSPNTPTYTETDIQIPVRDGTLIGARIHKPTQKLEDGSPVFVMYHGGGFCLGGLDNETLLCRKWTELGGVAVNVDYRLAPENRFPVPVEDAYDALKWTAQHFTELGGNPTKGFIVGGVSAGANFASVLSHLYLEEKHEPALTGVYLSIPACVPPELVPEKYKEVYLSREQNKDAPVLDIDAIDTFEHHYSANLSSPLYSPLSLKNHSKLPPHYFQICGLDPLRDDGLIYERILREESGVKTEVKIFPGLPHAFWSWWPETAFGREYQEECVRGMKWLLSCS